ncbi:MAG: non-canonical purine NTP pyrophosphatase, partial [Candidatus Bathyarchaeia archaeon]
MRRTVLFATSNMHKLREATEILSKFKLRVTRASLKPIELQADDIRSIALTACESIIKKRRQPVLVEDSGLFVKGLGGFPGAYSSFVYRTIGVEGVLRLMDGRQARKAEFRSALAFS